MSFSIGTVFSLAGAVGRLIDGEPPGLKLDDVLLDNYEAPDKVGFGGEQQMTVHKLTGGARVVDLMGRDDRDIKLSGFLEGPNAVSKARQLDDYRKNGGIRRLSWADEVRRVVIRGFECDYQYAGQWLPYSISLLVIPPKAGESETSTSSSFFGDLAKSLGLSELTSTLTQAQGYLQQAQAALPIVGAINPRLASTLEGYTASANGVMSGAVSVSEGRLSGISAVGTGFSGLAGATRNTNQTQAAGDMAASLAAQAFAGRVSGNARSLASGG